MDAAGVHLHVVGAAFAVADADVQLPYRERVIFSAPIPPNGMNSRPGWYKC